MTIERIRLWAREQNGSAFLPATFAFSPTDKNSMEFNLGFMSSGWIIVEDPKDPNKCTREELVNMAIEIKKISEKNGITSWLVRPGNMEEYTERVMKVDWDKIGYVDAKKLTKARQPKPEKPVSTEAREALEKAKAELTQKKGIPPMVVKMAEKFHGNSTKIPGVMLKTLEQYYTVNIDENGLNILAEKIL